MVKKWCAPPALLEHHAQVNTVPRPENGWVNALLDTVESSPAPADLRRGSQASAAQTAIVTATPQQPREGLEARAAAHVAMLGEEDLGPAGLVNKPSLGGMLAAEPAPEPSEQLPMLPDIPGATPEPLGTVQSILEACCHMNFCSKTVSNSGFLVINQKYATPPATPRLSPHLQLLLYRSLKRLSLVSCLDCTLRNAQEKTSNALVALCTTVLLSHPATLRGSSAL